MKVAKKNKQGRLSQIVLQHRGQAARIESLFNGEFSKYRAVDVLYLKYLTT